MLKYFALFLLLNIAFIHCLDENSYFANSADLDGDNYRLDWNYTDTEITFKVTAKTSGWVGFGLSPNGGMLNSDVVLVWTGSDGTVEFNDAHVESNPVVLYDSVKNWKMLYHSRTGSDTDAITTLIFKRDIKVCNPPHALNEINIQVSDTSYVIYAWGTAFGADQRPGYHMSNRGSKSLPLLSALNRKEVEIDMSEIETYDFETNLTLANNVLTTYQCFMFKMPEELMQTKRHIIRVETILNEETSHHVHHWLMYECGSRYENEFLVNRTSPEPSVCTDGKGVWGEVRDSGLCSKISLGWAVGGNLVQDIPEGFGYAIGPTEFKYFFLEMHYENPAMEKDVFVSTKLRLWTTKNLRPTEFGILTVGTASTPLNILLPPKMDRISLEYTCRNDFLNNIFGDNEKITIFAHLPHTHLAGRSLYSKVIRNKKEVEYIGNNKYYDFNYQYVNFLKKPVVMRRGDELSVNCIYSTLNRNRSVVSGLATHDEMCLDFLWYYPKSSTFNDCYDNFEFNSMLEFFDSMNKTGKINWQFERQNFFRDSMRSVEESEMMKNPEYVQKLFQEYFDTSKRNLCSYGTGSCELYDAFKVERMPEDSCPPTLIINGATTIYSASLLGLVLNGLALLNHI